MSTSPDPSRRAPRAPFGRNGLCVLLFGLLSGLLSGLLEGAPASAAAPGLLRESDCRAAACGAAWAQLRAAFAVTYGAAERDGASMLDAGPIARRYRLAPTSRPLSDWWRDANALRAVVFAQRDGDRLVLEAVAFVPGTSAPRAAQGTQRVALVLDDAPNAQERALTAALARLASEPLKPLPPTAELATRAASSSVVGLIEWQPTGETAVLDAPAPIIAFVPDAIHIGASGTPPPAPRDRMPAGAAADAPALAPGDTVVSNKPGETVVLHHAANGQPSSVTFSIDPMLAPAAAGSQGPATQPAPPR